MKRATTIIIVIILLFTACSCNINYEIYNDEYNYTYKGENQLWTVEYYVKGYCKFNKSAYDSYTDFLMLVTYKRDLSDLTSVKHLEISYKSDSHSSMLSEDLNGNGIPPVSKTFILENSERGGSIPKKEKIIKVNINIGDGKIQTIKLKYVE